MSHSKPSLRLLYSDASIYKKTSCRKLIACPPTSRCDGCHVSRCSQLNHAMLAACTNIVWLSCYIMRESSLRSPY